MLFGDNHLKLIELVCYYFDYEKEIDLFAYYVVCPAF